MQRALLASCLALLAAAATAQSQGIQLTTGIDGGVDLPADPLFAPPTGITVEAWITYDDATVPTGLYYWPTIARHDIGAGAEVWFLRVGAAQSATRALQWTVRTSPTTTQNVTYFFQPGELAQFTHIAATYDGRFLALYKNGQQVASRTLTTSAAMPYNGGVTRIGNGDAVNPGNESWNGVIDEFRIWPMARTAAEIQATMNQSVGGLPSGVITFPLDGFLIDTSSLIMGTQFGTMTYVPGAPAVNAVLTQVGPVGGDTTTCAQPILALVGSLPETGNADFAVWATGGPRPGQSPFGVVVAAGAAASAGQPPVAGVALAFDPSSTLALTAVPAADPLGNTRFGLPIPAAAGLVGTTLLFQFGYVDSSCGPQGFSASRGVSFAVQ